MPRIASLHAAGNAVEIKNKLDKSSQFIFFISLPMVAGIIVVAPVFLPWFLGKGFDDASGLLQILSILLLMIGLSGLFGNGTLLACGKEKQYTLCIICGAFVNFVLNCILISAMLAKGAAIASVAAEAVVTITMLYCIREKISVIALLINFIKYLIASGVMTSILLIVIKYIQCQTIFKLAIVIPTGVLTYGLALLILRDNLVFDIISKMKHTLLKKQAI
jgi:O-antigen/teichoic acid export membrane protein